MRTGIAVFSVFLLCVPMPSVMAGDIPETEMIQIAVPSATIEGEHLVVRLDCPDGYLPFASYGSGDKGPWAQYGCQGGSVSLLNLSDPATAEPALHLPLAAQLFFGGPTDGPQASKGGSASLEDEDHLHGITLACAAHFMPSSFEGSVNDEPVFRLVSCHTEGAPHSTMTGLVGRIVRW